jgi:peptide/nickel transport system substrate-binding protein
VKAKRLVILIVTAALLLTSVAGISCRKSGEGEQESIEQYVIADATGDWGYPSPYLRYARGPGYIRSSLIFDTLVWKDEEGFVPALAKEWEYDDSGNSYTFELQQNAKWHDGEKFTADDVAFTIEYLKVHPDPFVTLIGETGVQEAEIIDEYTIKLWLEQPYAPFLNDVASTVSILPKHVWEGVDDPMTFDGPEAVIGTGPYKLVDYDKAQGSYLYEAFDEYYLGRPKVERLVFVKTSEELAPVALEQGDVDSAGIQADWVEDLQSKGFTVIKCPYGWNAKLTINHKKAPLNTKEFRQALAYAIDRQALVDVTQRGYGIAGSPGIIAPDSPWYNPAMDSMYPYDPAKARQLLESLGYELGSNGYYYKDGKQLELEILTQTTYGFKDVGQFIKNALEAVGIKINLVVLEGKTLDAKVGAWEFDLSIYGHGGIYEPSILTKVITGPSFNSARYTANPTLSQLLEDQLAEMDPEARLEMVKEIQELYAEDVPALTLYYPDSYWAHDGQVNMFYTAGGVASGIPIAINKMAFVG